MAKFIFHKKGEKMKGVVLTNGIIRAEDGNRYSFELGDVVNLNDLSDLSELEVDFEPHENTAKSICLLNQKVAQKAQNKIATKCEEIASFGRYHVFRGVANLQKEDSVGSLGVASFSGTASSMSGLLGSLAISDKHLKIGDEYFRIQGFKGVDGIIENGDEIVISGYKSKGAWLSFNYGNISKRYTKTRSFILMILGSFAFLVIGSILFSLIGALFGEIGASIGFLIAVAGSLWLLKISYNEKQANNYIKKICNC